MYSIFENLLTYRLVIEQKEKDGKIQFYFIKQIQIKVITCYVFIDKEDSKETSSTRVGLIVGVVVLIIVVLIVSITCYVIKKR